MDRRAEIRELLALTPDEARRRAGERLVVCPDIDALHQQMAQDIAGEIEANNSRSQPTRLILPVGPTGQYPFLARLIREQNIALANCWFFFMDEYCDADGRVVDVTHPLSFKRAAMELFFNHLPGDAGLDDERVFFPDERNIDRLPGLIEELGGIDTCYGGIGIHGHVAFNEPEPGARESKARRARLNDFTVTMNVIRSGVGGNLEGFPRFAYTLGMKEILASRQIRLYCRNGCEFDWANTVLRLALFGAPGDDYPVTYIRDHPHYVVVTDAQTLALPHIIL